MHPHDVLIQHLGEALVHLIGDGAHVGQGQDPAVAGVRSRGGGGADCESRASSDVDALSRVERSAGLLGQGASALRKWDGDYVQQSQHLAVAGVQNKEVEVCQGKAPVQSGHGMVPIWGRASALNLYEGWAMKVERGARRALETRTSGVDTGAVWGLLAPPSAHPSTTSLQVRSMIASIQ